MHDECRRLDRAEYWRARRRAEALEAREGATERKAAELAEIYEQRVGEARAEADYYRQLHNSPLWRMLTGKATKRQLRDLLDWVSKEPEPDGPYGRNAWRDRRNFAHELLNAIQQTVDERDEWE